MRRQIAGLLFTAILCLIPVCALSQKGLLRTQPPTESSPGARPGARPDSRSVPTAPPLSSTEQVFRDTRFGVKFRVPAGWKLVRRDGEVSTFHLDARTAPRRAQVRGVASIDFNPFPMTTLSGAMFYFSVEPHTSDAECAKQAAKPGQEREFQEIGGMTFAHGHDEHGDICVEARDEVYTAYRKGSCYRFDLEINTFCSVSSGAQEITERQLDNIVSRMTGILSSVTLDWNKTGANAVPLPGVASQRDVVVNAPAVGPGLVRTLL